MPKVIVKLPHQGDPPAMLEKARPAIEKTVTDFQGYDLQVEAAANDQVNFAFKSMAFSIKGNARATASEVIVEVDLPFAAMMFKDQAERAIAKNLKRALEADQ
jgi:hypothetical protein